MGNFFIKCKSYIVVRKMMADIEEKFWVSTEMLMTIAKDMEATMNKGLENEASSSIKMLVTYVDSLPTGNEKGCFYALDLGGTKLRVMRVRLPENTTTEPEFVTHTVPYDMKVGTLKNLFDFIAEKVAILVESEKDSGFTLHPDHKRELGFTFSFPVHQTRINAGTLINWTKEFDIDEAIGKDMVVELTTALQEKCKDMNVTALLNDAVGTLARGIFDDKNVMAAVIFGTGTNAAYIEQKKDILKLNSKDLSPQSEHMVINTEWGNFDSNLPLTEYDRALDKDSPNPSKQILEKMISGSYLGEIVRTVLLHLAEEAEFFGNTVPPLLQERNVLRSDIVSAMHDDNSSDLNVVGEKLKEIFEISDVPFEKRQMIVKICEIVSTRAARLSAASILSILKRLGRDSLKGLKTQETVVAVDGGLYTNYQQFKSCLEKTLKEELLEKGVSETVILRHYADASGIGAAIVAASHSSNPRQP